MKSNLKPMRILTPEQRLLHINRCKENDSNADNHEPGYWDLVGDCATFNTNTRHNPEGGFLEFYSDTPLWVVLIAIRRKWASMRTIMHKCQY